MSTVDLEPHDDDRALLHSLGYAQELNRGMGMFSNFAISFSIISILAGGFTSFWIGATFGGPLAITLGWLIVGLFVLFVGMSMAEICSAYPTAGGLYFWAAKLAKRNPARWSWFTGWFNFVGLIGVIASVDYALANYVVYFINQFSANADDPIITISFLFEYQNNSAWSGGISTIYVFFLGFLLAQYTITGFDASAHVSEETVGARTAAPKAIVRSIWISAVAALVLNAGFLLAMPDEFKNKDASVYGITFPAVIFDAVLEPSLSRLLVFISTIGQFFCGLACVTAASRMMYAFSRDNGLPGSKLWHRINPKTRTPTNAVWLAVGVAAVTGTLSLVQKDSYSVAFFALTGICVIGLYASYVLPIYLRVTSDDFVQGPWNLGRYSKLVGWISIVWVLFISILFMSPLFPAWKWWDPDQVNSANFTGPLIFLSFLFVGLWWAVSAHKWFKGPKVQGTPEEILAIERELERLEHT